MLLIIWNCCSNNCWFKLSLTKESRDVRYIIDPWGIQWSWSEQEQVRENGFHSLLFILFPLLYNSQVWASPSNIAPMSAQVYKPKSPPTIPFEEEKKAKMQKKLTVWRT